MRCSGREGKPWSGRDPRSQGAGSTLSYLHAAWGQVHPRLLRAVRRVPRAGSAGAGRRAPGRAGWRGCERLGGLLPEPRGLAGAGLALCPFPPGGHRSSLPPSTTTAKCRVAASAWARAALTSWMDAAARPQPCSRTTEQARGEPHVPGQRSGRSLRRRSLEPHARKQSARLSPLHHACLTARPAEPPALRSLETPAALLLCPPLQGTRLHRGSSEPAARGHGWPEQVAALQACMVSPRTHRHMPGHPRC